MAVTSPTGEIWFGTIAKFTFVGVMYMCATFGAFTTKCTIHSLFGRLAAGLYCIVAITYVQRVDPCHQNYELETS